MGSSIAYPQLWFTYGPKTTSDSMLRSLIEAGATGARFTFSYGTVELQVARARQVRKIADEIATKLFLVADLQGDKCRLREISGVDEIRVERGVPLVLTTGPPNLSGERLVLSVQGGSLIPQAKLGDIIVEGDGGMLLQAVDASPNGLVCVPRSDGVIHPGRGLVVRSADFRPTALTSKDLGDLDEIANTRAFDAVAVSFVNGPGDVLKAKEALSAAAHPMPVFAKIETAPGLSQVDAIASAADGLVAARGDLALCTPWETLFSAVEQIRSAASQNGRPWILATQLAEGLERFSFLTRAEICDLAHWMRAGAFGALLSYETAFGPRPVDAVACVRAVMQRYLCEQQSGSI